MSKKRATAVSWKIRPMPPQHTRLELDGSYTRTEYVTISQGFIPQSMEDKWFIYLEGDWLHFHRSWTGTCVFQLKIIPVEDRYAAVEAVVNRDPSQYRGASDAYDVELMAHLIDQLLLGRFSPFPQMHGLSEEDQARHKRLVMGGGDKSMNLKILNNGRSS